MKYTKKIIHILTVLLFIGVLGFLYHINGLNYQKHNEIKYNTVQHPENLPTKQMALYTSFGYKNLISDIYWLETIQYIGGNAISSEYKKYLFVILDLVTELNPYFEHPYIIGELLLPDYNQRYEKLNEEEIEKYIDQGIELGMKGINTFCDPEKIRIIKEEFDLKKLWTDQKYRNPCKSSDIPYHLAYIYYFHKHDPLTASLYYKIASANTDSLEGAKTMAAIMQGKGGDREKSYFMFLNMAKYIDQEDEVCINLATELETIGLQVFLNKSLPLNGKLLQAIATTREQAFGLFSESDENSLLADSQCSNYVNKATRELNLEYIETANNIYKESNQGVSATTVAELLEAGYINYKPIDFQQYEDSGIIYKLNEDTGNFDYKMGN